MAKEINGWFDEILAQLHQHTGVDFANYKQATLRRRIERRMNAHKIRSFNEYCAYLRKHPNEAKALFNDILIPVTSFFRDPEVFKALKADYFPQMLQSDRSGPSIRVWVPACSTGEELYSLAMILAELKEAKKDSREIQIFGTDISEPALEKARAGVYPRSIGKEVSGERLRRFFEPVKGGFIIRREIRDVCVFARHNLAVDPPFSNLDCISCRNALIYMTAALQSRILAVFHFALKPEGLLLLGPSEATSGRSEQFSVGDRKINLFHRKARLQKDIPPAFLPRSSDLDRPAHKAVRHAAAESLKELNPSQLRLAVEKMIERGADAENTESHVVPITIPRTGEKAYLVFGDPEKREKGKPPGPSRPGRSKGSNLEVENAKLRKDLFSVRKAIKMIIEQQEATNEELRASNEEVVSSNEELQSTNEELETAKEELQASNEELATLNGELENRNLELERANVMANHFKAIVESSEDAIISKDLNGIILTWNRAAEKIFGYTAGEAVGKPVTILFSPEAIDDELRILARIRTGESIEHYETVRKRKDGSLPDISLTVSPIKNSAGQVIGASKIARDITEKKRAEAAAKKYEAIVASSDDAIISKDLNGIIQTWNRGAEKIFGYTAEEAVGKPVTILIPPDHINEEPGILARIRAGESIDHYETVRIRKDGRRIDISLTVSPIKNNAGEVIGASKIVRDISEKKRWEMELKRARDEAETASRAKDHFLAALSHELRTPLNPVLLVASDAVADPDLPPGVRANFDIILKNIELEAKLIDDLLDLARVRSGKLKVEKSCVNIYSILTSTLAIVQNDIDQKRIRLKQNFRDTQSIILGDAVRLQQVFWNVLKNAVKFTPIEGMITIETRATREKCIVKFSDSGIGMSRDELAHVFDPFKQGDHSLQAHRFGGLGLGLTISKNLVELHSGTIEAYSDGPGRGSCITMTFPLAEWNESNQKRLLSPGRINHHSQSPALQVLLVDDHEATRSALARLLANRNHKVTVAGSVREALAMSDKTRFDLVISDIGLPDGSGYDLFKRILKRSPDARGIAMSGYGMDKDLARSKDSGFSMHLTKPVKMDALDEVLAQFSK
ncbi:MAG TPA: PAS domain S-box protein [Candidatus Acidoferrales bacterium]|jgi:two-component system CheB/CheR fusion protein|nr:PAS domain S-box protein [Candidatus Acidoferrales bacterium]